MNKEDIKDYVFNVNWEDRHKEIYKIGILAQLDQYFYLIIKDEKSAEKAYKSGFKGLPGFKTDEVYKSLELFDFFKNRVLRTPNVDFCEELGRTGGKSMIDSFSVEVMAEGEIKEYKTKILEAHRLQEALKKVRDRKADDQQVAIG